MKSLICVGIALLGMFAIAADAAKPASDKLTPEQRKARAIARNGGLVPIKGTPSGQIIVVNAQKRFSEDNLDIGKQKGNVRTLATVTKIVTGEPVTPMTAQEAKTKLGCDFALFVVNDASLPPSLIAPEARWAILNIAAVTAGAKNEELARIRVRNEFARVFGMLCGGFSSHFDAPLTNHVTGVADLEDVLVDLPIDFDQKLLTYMARCGVRPLRTVSYRRACQEGWAPQPTNDVQQAIWKQVHELPKKPLKLEK